MTLSHSRAGHVRLLCTAPAATLGLQRTLATSKGRPHLDALRWRFEQFNKGLGMGEDYYPLPWSKLDYDTQLGGYRVDITENQLKGVPKFTRSTDWDWSNRTNDEKVYKYYYNEPVLT
jgi:hypothetical protein